RGAAAAGAAEQRREREGAGEHAVLGDRVRGRDAAAGRAAAAEGGTGGGGAAGGGAAGGGSGGSRCGGSGGCGSARPGRQLSGAESSRPLKTRGSGVRGPRGARVRPPGHGGQMRWAKTTRFSV